MVAAMPRRCASTASPAAPASGAQLSAEPAPSAKDEVKCEIGSDTPKNIRPMPMPAANSIENQVA